MKSPTITTVAQELLASPQAPKHPVDCNQLVCHVKKFTDWIGRELLIDELTPELVNEFTAAMAAAGSAELTAVQYRYHLQRVWRFAHGQGYCDTLPEKNPPRHHASENHVATPRKPKAEPVQKPKQVARKIKPAPRSEAAKQRPVAKNEPVTFVVYTEKYLDSHDVCRDYAQRIRGRVRAFVEWLGEEIMVRDVTCELVNEYITALQQTTELESTTINNYRADLRAVWFDAYQLDCNEHPPLRLRRVPKLREAIEAFTHEEINKLLVAAKASPDFYRNGVNRSVLWRAAILSAYSTGLRRADMLAVRRSQILPTRVATIKQQKTGFPVVVKFSVEAVECIGQIAIPDDDRALPFPYGAKVFGCHFRELVKAAGVRPGTFKWLRRAAGSYAESMQPGGGTRLLGHRDANVFNNHYRDDSIVQQKPIEPPELVAVG